MTKRHHVDWDTLDDKIRESVRPESGFSDRAVEEFREFVREGQFVVDNTDVHADRFYWLDPLYDLRRSDLIGVKNGEGGWMQRPNPKYRGGIMLRKSSQGGATAFVNLLLAWFCIDPRRGLNVGTFLPNEDDTVDFVQMRLMPLLESSEKMRPYLQKSPVNNTRSKKIGRSNLLFRYVNGTSQTDSFPMDIILGDEVRLWGAPDRVSGIMQRVEERFGQSEIGLKIWTSTVGSPGDAMELLWAESNQTKYFSLCPGGCATEVREKAEDSADRVVPPDERHTLREGALVVEGVCLSDWHPHEITRWEGDPHDTRAPAELVWCCPKCKAEVTPRVGPGFVETFPFARGMYGLEFARTLYEYTITPAKLRTAHDTAKDKKQFWNGWLAKPFKDPAGALVKDDHIRAARSNGRVQWYVGGPPPRDISTTYLGADLRTDEIHVVILGTRDAGGDNEDPRGQIVWLGVLQGTDESGRDPFAQLEHLVRLYRVQLAIIDYRPHTTSTLAIARRNPAVVFLASYVKGEMIRDKKANSAATRAAEDDVRETNIKLIDRTLSLKYSLNSFAMGNWMMSPEALEQPNFYRRRILHPYYDVAWEFTDHLQNIALSHKEKVTKNASGEAVGAAAQFDEEFVNVAYDPHFVHAFNYAVMAARSMPMGARVIGGGKIERPLTNPLGLAVPVPSSVSDKRCGNCRWWEGEDQGDQLGVCSRLLAKCRATDPPCPYRLYRRR